MMQSFESYGFLTAAMVVGVILALLGLKMVRHFIPYDDHESHHHVAASFLSITGTLYAVVLGFMVVDALNTFQKARVLVEQEANGFHDVFHLARGLRPEACHKLQNGCMSYMEEMVNAEWATMEDGNPSPKSPAIVASMWHDLTAYQPKTPGEQTFLAALIEEMKAICDARRSRLLAAKPAYDPLLWSVLVTGSIITVVFTYFFEIKNMKVQMAMTALITIILSLNLIVVVLFSHPFRGDVKVSPEPYRQNVDTFKNEMPEVPLRQQQN